MATNKMYLETIVVKIEESMLPVPRGIFTQSPVFQDMWTLPQNPQYAPDGSDKEHPLRLEGLKLSDFNLFVCVAIASEIAICQTNRVHQSSNDLQDNQDTAANAERDRMGRNLASCSSLGHDSPGGSYCVPHAVLTLCFAMRTQRLNWYTYLLERLIQTSNVLLYTDIILLGPQLSSALINLRNTFRYSLLNNLWSDVASGHHKGSDFVSKGVQLDQIYNKGFPSPYKMPFEKEAKIRFDALVAACKDVDCGFTSNHCTYA
jgi:hypothetical protein